MDLQYIYSFGIYILLVKEFLHKPLCKQSSGYKNVSRISTSYVIYIISQSSYCLHQFLTAVIRNHFKLSVMREQYCSFRLLEGKTLKSGCCKVVLLLKHLRKNCLSAFSSFHKMAAFLGFWSLFLSLQFLTTLLLSSATNFDTPAFFLQGASWLPWAYPDNPR